MESLSISLSGLKAQTTRLSATASNIANLATPNYKAQRVVMTTNPSGGVLAVLSRDLSPGRPIPQTEGLPAQDKETSNVDLATELVNLMTIRQGFRANLQAVKTILRTKGSVLDVVS